MRVLFYVFLPFFLFAQEELLDIDMKDVLDEPKQQDVKAAKEPKQEKPKEKIAFLVASDHPPYMFMDNEKRLQGLYPKLIQEIAKNTSIEPVFEVHPWPKALELAKKENKGLVGIFKSDNREEIFDFSEPIFDEKIKIFVLENNVFSFTKIEDLKFKTIGMIKGFSYGSMIDKARKLNWFNIVEKQTGHELFLDLIAGNTYCVAMDESTAMSIQLNNSYDKTIVSLDHHLASTPVFLAYAKSFNKQEFLRKFNNALLDFQLGPNYTSVISDFLKETFSSL